MKRLWHVVGCALILFSGHLSAQHVQYLSPVPQSQLVSLGTNIIIRADAMIDAATVSSSLLEVEGSRSGTHGGTLMLSDDGQTLVFNAESRFAAGESVHVSLKPGVRMRKGSSLDPVTFTFTTTSLRVPLTERYYVTETGEVLTRETKISTFRLAGQETASVLDSLPSDFPRITVDTTSSPTPGYFLLGTTEQVGTNGMFVFMMDNTGKVVKYKRTSGGAYDFKQQPNGYYSYAEGYSPWIYAGGNRVVHRVVDSTLAPVDSFKAGNGYEADGHEFLMLANGHVLLHAYDIQYMDLSTVAPGGNPNAIVVGSILQELDLSKNVVFQWRSWDYVPITDTYNSISSSAFDYIHVNAYDIDDDGNILACFRVTCQILKINRMTGEIMWKMGGKQNQFTFIGENAANTPNYFTFQHCLRRLPNGNFTLFDNGNLHPAQVSRAVEYKVDQINKIATLVWEYRHTPDIFVPQRGSVQRLENGNTVIGWGNAASVGIGRQSVTEIRPDKSTAFEMEFQDATSSYRALKYLLSDATTPAASVTVYDVLPGNRYRFSKGDSVVTGVSIELMQGSAGYNNISVRRYTHSPSNMSFAGLPPFVQPLRWGIKSVALSGYIADITFDSTTLAPYANKRNAVVYTRSVEGQGLFAPVATTYDSVLHSLTVTVTQLGEYVIGVPETVRSPVVPKLALPGQNAKVNQSEPVLIRWLSTGHLTGSHLQVAVDSLFAVCLVNDSSLRSSAFRFTIAAAGTKYFWRARVRNELGISDWSATGTFTTTAPFFSVTSPQLGDKLAPGTTTIIRWESNTGSIISLRLYRNGVFASKINDSTVNTGRYQWKLAATGLPTDTTYTVRVRNFDDTATFGESKKFAVAPAAGVVQGSEGIGTYSLDQNYPNPFNPSTKIGYRVSGLGASNNGTEDGALGTEALGAGSGGSGLGSRVVRLAVYDILGREVAVLVNDRKEPGEYSVTWDARGIASGVYFYRMQSGDFVATKRLLLLR
jgi:hypothetical protein